MFARVCDGDVFWLSKVVSVCVCVWASVCVWPWAARSLLALLSCLLDIVSDGLSQVSLPAQICSDSQGNFCHTACVSVCLWMFFVLLHDCITYIANQQSQLEWLAVQFAKTVSGFNNWTEIQTENNCFCSCVCQTVRIVLCFCAMCVLVLQSLWYKWMT